jgi:hypothetical protein
MELKSLQLAAKLLQAGSVQNNTEPLVELCNAVHTNKENMSASKGVCKELLKDTSVLQDNIMDYKSDIDNLKSILHSIKNWQIADAIVLTINKFSSRCVVTKEEFTSIIKWLDIVAGRRISQRNFKKSTLHDIPIVISGLVVSKMEDNRLSSNLNTSHMCKISPTKPENKDHKIIIIGDSHAQGCAARMNDYFSDNAEVSGYVKPGVPTDILVKTASNEINNLIKKMQSFCGDYEMMLVTTIPRLD